MRAQELLNGDIDIVLRRALSGIKKEYDETPYVLDAILSLEEGHRYAWSFKVDLTSRARPPRRRRGRG